MCYRGSGRSWCVCGNFVLCSIGVGIVLIVCWVGWSG